MGKTKEHKTTEKRKRIPVNRLDSITVRLKTADKKRIEKQAKENGMSISEYVREKLFSKNNFKGQEANVAVIMIEVQNVLNYMEEKGLIEGNEILKEKVDGLWEKL